MEDLNLGAASFKMDNMHAIIDSGTSVIVGPADLVKNMTAGFPATINCTTRDQYDSLFI